MDNRTILRQFALIFVVTFVTIFLLLRSDLISQMAYSVEKGRLKALRESMPSAEEISRASLPARQVAQLVMPAVVSIETEAPASEWLVQRLFEGWSRTHEQEDTDEARRSLEEYLARPSSVGSGFVIDAERGLILTNHHVITGAQTIRVHLADGRTHEARVVGSDPETDLVVISIEADRLHTVQFGDSDQVRIGDDVFALGSPFGLAGSVSRGIISGRGRSPFGIRGTVYQGFLQTDAVINPGNSGGPLVNLRGEVIGVNTAIATQTGRYDGVAFAIPASRVAEVLPALIRGQRVVRGFLGIRPQAVVDQPTLAAELGWSEAYGMIVDHVAQDSAAAEAGLQAGDVILQLDGVRQEDVTEFREQLARTPPGTTVPLEIWRDGQTITRQATLRERPRY